MGNKEPGTQDIPFESLDEQTEAKKMKPNVYFLSLVATDANERNGRGVPRKAHYFFDVRSEMELAKYGVKFLSSQDLASFHDQNNSQDQYENPPNIYQLVVFFMAHHPTDFYFIDEAPLLKGKQFIITQLEYLL